MHEKNKRQYRTHTHTTIQRGTYQTLLELFSLFFLLFFPLFRVEWKVSIKPDWIMCFNIKLFVVAQQHTHPSIHTYIQIDTHSLCSRQLLTPIINVTVHFYSCGVVFCAASTYTTDAHTIHGNIANNSAFDINFSMYANQMKKQKQKQMNKSLDNRRFYVI